jgi:hypothetical protein
MKNVIGQLGSNPSHLTSHRERPAGEAQQNRQNRAQTELGNESTKVAERP